MRWFLILFWLITLNVNAAFTEFYCDATASVNNTNVNAGSTTGAPVYGPSVNGNWDGTSVFTPTDGSTPASTVSAGMWASVYLDAATVAVYIALVTNVAAGANGAITLSQAAFMGTKPAAGATGRTIRVGGCWNGPFGSVGFPLTVIAQTATNGPMLSPRVNMINSNPYNITANITVANAGPYTIQGYASSPGDGGRWILDGGSSGTSFNPLNAGLANVSFIDMIVQGNGASGASAGISVGGASALFHRVTIRNVRGSGFTTTGTDVTLSECEVAGCNQSSTADNAGFVTATAHANLINCISHDNTGVTTHGFKLGIGTTLINCIAYNNGKDGFYFATGGSTTFFNIIGCDAWNNNTNGLDFFNTAQCAVLMKNCNFLKNGLSGVTNTGAALRYGLIMNCGIGSGTQANGVDGIATSLGSIQVSGTVTYPANSTPWVDPANGNFRINLAAAKSAGRGEFTQITVNSPTNTVAFPDIGAAQSPSTNAAVGGGSWTFSQ